jgi:autophagy-related protein 2
MFESMWSSMTSSMQLAEECLKQGSSDGNDAEESQPLEGLELFAQAIDSSMFYAHYILCLYQRLHVLLNENRT